MRIPILICFFLCLSLGLSAQQGVDPPPEKKGKVDLQFGQRAVLVSYVGNLGWQPGLSVGMEVPIWEKFKEKTKRNGKLKDKYRFWCLTGNAGFWVHPHSYSAQFVRAGVLWRKVRTRGGKVEAALFMGAVNRFNAGRTYTVREDGSVKRRFWDGSIYAMPTLMVGFGKDHLFAPKPRKFAWHIRPQFSLTAPYNTSLLPGLGLEVGMSFYIWNDLFNQKPKP